MLTSSQIRSASPSKLTLPPCPKNLSKMSREALLEQYDHVGDYWATWLGRASMLPETQDRMTDKQLREIIKLMLSPGLVRAGFIMIMTKNMKMRTQLSMKSGLADWMLSLVARSGKEGMSVIVVQQGQHEN